MSVIERNWNGQDAADRLRAARAHVTGKELHLEDLLADKAIGRVALVSSFGAESAMLIDRVLSAAPLTDVIFIDTGKHFSETLAYVEALTRHFPIRNMKRVRPDGRLVSGIDPDGTLWRDDPDQCCTIRKVFPLDVALAGYDTWITGRKRAHGGLRHTVELLEADATHLKINPLAHVSEEEIEVAYRTRGLPRHQLGAAGYRSIGCAVCTRPTPADGSARDGRWAGRAKTECGIHRPRAA